MGCRDSAGEIGLIWGQLDDLRNKEIYQWKNEVVDFVIGVLFHQLGQRLDGPITNHSLIMRTQVLQDGQHNSMLRAERRGNIGQFLSNSKDNLIIFLLDET